MTGLTTDRNTDGSPATTTPKPVSGGQRSPLLSTCQQLSTALARSLAQLGLDPARIHIAGGVQQRQPFGAQAQDRQFVVTFDESSVTITPSDKACTPACLSAPAATVTACPRGWNAHLGNGANGRDPIAALNESLFNAGIDPGTIS